MSHSGLDVAGLTKSFLGSSSNTQKGGSDTTGDVGNIFGEGTERLLPTAEVLGNELPVLYSEHFKSLIFSIQLRGPMGQSHKQLLIFFL